MTEPEPSSEPPADEKDLRTGRRRLLKGLGLAGGGLVLGAAGALEARNLATRNVAPTSAMAVPTAGQWRPASGHVDVAFAVSTSQKLVALTFDDGPMPNWTPMVHDVLDEMKVKATFMLVGERLEANARLVADRMDRHEVGNHTWNHCDLAKLTDDEAYRQFARAHETFHRILGKEARFARPPFGHLGGTAISAAGRMGYDLVLWSIKMLEKTYEKQPRQLVEYITNETVPGTIILAHDTGNPDRLVALNNLRPMIANLRAKGFEFVTVSELRAAQGT